MIVSIHQPNYLPWLGYFDKIIKSDIFVIFDDVQYPRGKKGFFGNRNQIKTNNGKMWLTVPVIGKGDFKNFNEIEINYNGWNKKHIQNIYNFYKKATYFDKYFEDIKIILMKEHSNLSELSTELILYFMEVLDIDTKIMYSSEFKTEKTGGDKIMYILKELNATEYISGNGPGSLRYINEEDFSDRNIKLTWQEYKHPEYKQLHSEFISHLSVLDLLFISGDKSKEVISS